MGQIIIPSDAKYKGPWLLDLKSLEDLVRTLDEIDKKLEEAFLNSLNAAVETKIEESKKSGKELDFEATKSKLKSTYPFNKIEKYVLISTEQKKKIMDENLISLLKSGQIDEFHPQELIIKIQKGPCEFALEVSSKFDGEVETRIKVPDEIIFNDINYLLNKWLEKFRPSKIMQKWSSWFPGAALFFIPVLILVISPLFKSSSDIYIEQLEQEARQLLRDSLTSQEVPKAIEILLKKDSKYIPESLSNKIAFEAKNGYALLCGVVALGVLLIKPKTVIGLGKNKWKVAFYRRWTYFILVFIPVSIIIPILVNKLS